MTYNRYQTSEIKQTSSNKRYQAVLIPTIPEEDNNDIFIISKRGDRLDVLADKYYGDVNRWTTIALANNLVDMFVEPNIQLRIPINL